MYIVQSQSFMMITTYMTFILFMALCFKGVYTEAAPVKLPSDRLHYDRKNAKGPMVRGDMFRRARKDKSDKSTPADSNVTSDKSDGNPPPSESPLRWDPYNNSSPSLNKRLDMVIPKCKVHASYPYDISPTIDITGVKGLFNAILVGYQSPHSVTRENKGSMFGWSTVVGGEGGNGVSISFNVNYAPINTAAMPTSYCALILQPPLDTNSATLRTFLSPPRHMKRSLQSTDAFAKFLKKKNINIVTSCCFQVFPDPNGGNSVTKVKSTESGPPDMLATKL